MSKRVKIKDLTPEDYETPPFSSRPVSPMRSWMHYLEAEATIDEIIAVIRAGHKPQWHAHNAKLWAVTVYFPQEVIYEVEGEGDFPSRGLMYYIMPDALELMPKDCLPTS